MIFVDGSAISGTPNYLENCRFQCNFKIWSWAKKRISVHINHVLRPLYKRYFCHINIVKWSRNKKKTNQKAHFLRYFHFRPVAIKFPIITFETYHHRKEKSYRGSRHSFGNGMTRVTTWEGVEYLVVTKVFFNIALLKHV